MKFGSLFEIKNGLNKEKEAFGHGNPIVNYMDINKNTLLRSCDVKGLVNTTEDECDRFKVQENDMFFTRTSESSEEIGLACAIDSILPETVFSGFLLRARPLEKLLSAYYAYMLRTYTYRKEIIKHSSITTRALTSGSLLSAMKIPKVNYQKQVTTTSYLSQIDNLIRVSKVKRESTSLHFNQLIKQIYSQSYNHQLLKSYCSIVSGYPFKSEDYMDHGIYEVVTISNVKGNRYVDKLNNSRVNFIPKNMPKECILHQGDILVSMTGNVGRTGLVNSPNMLLNQRVSKIIPNSTIDPSYLFYSLKYRLDTYLYQLAQGAAQLNISVKDIQSYKLPIIESSKQKKIGYFLSQMDNFVDKQKVVNILSLVYHELIASFITYISEFLNIKLK